jgi:hypothetical protein
MRFSNAADKTGGYSNAYTINGFTTVLNALEYMPKLTILVMQLPYL